MNIFGDSMFFLSGRFYISRRSVKRLISGVFVLLMFGLVLPIDAVQQTNNAMDDLSGMKIMILADTDNELPELAKRLVREKCQVTRAGQKALIDDTKMNLAATSERQASEPDESGGDALAQAVVHRLRGFDTVIVYIHTPMLDPVEESLIEYGKTGGRLLVLHHAIASAKMANPDWLDFMGIALHPRNDRERPWLVSADVTHTMVNLAPGHYITSHKVKYDREITYRSPWPDGGALPERLPAFDVKKTEVFHNQEIIDGTNKVRLFGYKLESPDGDGLPDNIPRMDDTSGWYKPVGDGWLFYLQAGHEASDFLNVNFSQVILNCLTWQPNDERCCASPLDTPIRSTVDLNIGEAQTVELTDGTQATVRLISLDEQTDSIRDAVRKATVTIEINGQQIELVSGMYRLPTPVKNKSGDGGVWVDCPVTRGYVHQSNGAEFNPWAMDADARVRIWPGGVIANAKRVHAVPEWIRHGTFSYPVQLGWFSSDTQMGNDPCYVNACDGPGLTGGIYYHYGLDFGGCENMAQVQAATDGLIVSVGGETLPGFERGTPVSPRYDVVYILDRRGWFYRYSHMASIYGATKLGTRVRQGQVIGLLGKEGGSGGWTHLHFGANAMQPSGRYGSEEAYAFAWQAYQAWKPTPLVAVARPHHLIEAGQEVTLDGSRSWSQFGTDAITRYEWTLHDAMNENSSGNSTDESIVTRRYDKPGNYSEMLKVTDREGRTAYDFAVVSVIHQARPKNEQAPMLHVAYYPTLDIRPAMPLTFKARSFGIDPNDGHETWDFGDGTPTVETQSDGNQVTRNPDGYVVLKHQYDKPGDYIVTIKRTNRHGLTGTTHAHVRVVK